MFKYYGGSSILASNRYAIYFDHKLSDYISGFPNIYSGRIGDIFYPLLKYCGKYNYNDKENGCPFSPYKENYLTNLRDNNLLLEKFYYLEEKPIKIEEIYTTNIDVKGGTFTNIEKLTDEYLKKIINYYI